MKLNDYPETDSLHFDLSEETGVATRETSEGVQLDCDAKGNLVGIDMDDASAKVQLEELIPSKLPGKVRTVAARRSASKGGARFFAWLASRQTSTSAPITMSRAAHSK